MRRQKELEAWLVELNEEIDVKEKQIQPLQEELDRLLEQRVHVSKLLELPTEESHASAPVSRKTWVGICREYRWPVNGDSAHRVVRRNDPLLHMKVPHDCIYDGMTYY